MSGCYSNWRYKRSVVNDGARFGKQMNKELKGLLAIDVVDKRKVVN